MKTPREIYAAYKTMPALQLHQMRVAAVGKLICDGFTKSINTRDVILACLFHDMGNILKFKLGQIPEFLEPEGLKYWKSIQSDYRTKYGDDEHIASEVIAKEIRLSVDVISCIASIKFSAAETTKVTGTFEQKICEYSDSRVGPRGVVSLMERLEEGRKRYLADGRKSSLASPQDTFDVLARAEHDIEKQIFSHTTTKPEDINDATVAPLVEECQRKVILS